MEELINNIKSKNYTYNRIKRLLLYILIGIKKEDISNFKNYIRILGFNKKGKDYLNRIKKEISLPIITNYSNSKGLLYLDNKVYSILSIILPLQEQKKYIDKDLKEKIRINIDNDENI